MKLGIAIAPLNKTNNAKDVLNKIHLLEELLNRRFDFIEGINNPSIMHEVIKHYPCYTLGSLIPRTDIDLVEQFMNACYLASSVDVGLPLIIGYLNECINWIYWFHWFFFEPRPILFKTK